MPPTTQSPAAQSPAAQFDEGCTEVAELRLREKIAHAAHTLPAQGPITVFVHHNTLHALEDLPFDLAVAQGADRYGCQPYLSEAQYHQHLASGRIQSIDLEAVLRADLGEAGSASVGGLCTRFALRMAMLEHQLGGGSEAELRWLVADSDALTRFRAGVSPAFSRTMVEETRHWTMRYLGGDESPQGTPSDISAQRIVQLADLVQRFGERSMEQWSEATWQAFCLQALWRACRHGVHRVHQPNEPTPRSLRPGDWLAEATGNHPDRLVDELLIRFCAAFLDQGLAQRPLPDRDLGFYQAFLRLYSQASRSPQKWLRRLSSEAKRLLAARTTPIASIRQSLDLLRISKRDEQSFLTSTLLTLRGWAGMIWQMESGGESTVWPAPPGTLLEYLAIRLLLERIAAQQVAEDELNYRGPLVDLKKKIRPPREANRFDLRTFTVFQVAQLLGWQPVDLLGLSTPAWQSIVQEIEQFSVLERRRLLHQAYERRYYSQALDALSHHVPRRQTALKPPRFQLMCCIDDREESFRRHLEEVAPDCQTFGTAGFFGVVMYYRGVAEAHFRPLCPIVAQPDHWVQEDAVDAFEEDHTRRAQARRAIGAASLHVHRGSRSFLGGAVVAILGSLASIPLIARVVQPRFTSRLGNHLKRFVAPPTVTQLRLERDATQPDSPGSHLGYTLAEMTDIVERLLRDIGLTTSFARLFIALGHGSSSLNNPHESAYNCGACAGGRGGPNARALAQMANDPRVRLELCERGLSIPDTTWFIGGYHNTCDDSVDYFDLDRLPSSHREDFQQAHQNIVEARQRNAHERCRRFDSAPLTISPEAALRHVEGRAEDLAQSRPEYNHATNALGIVGRREITRGLFLDRRAFLTCYDPFQDDEQHTILTGLLKAAIPVCAGINLEYYFSCVDAEGWGCGSKLPHNITAMLGVMEGAASDLRTGLSAQMVEIHEPVRILFVIETTPQVMEKVMAENAAIGLLVRNDWIRLATIDPDTGNIKVHRHGRFEPYVPESIDIPTAERSIDWYRGWRDHLGFASLRASLPAASDSGEQR